MECRIFHGKPISYITRYRLERSKKKEAIENAHKVLGTQNEIILSSNSNFPFQKVAAWTKKVMIERQNSGSGGGEWMAPPEVSFVLVIFISHLFFFRFHCQNSH